MPQLKTSERRRVANSTPSPDGVLASPVNLGSQVDQVNPDPHYFHSRGLQVLGLLWVRLEDGRGRGKATAKDLSASKLLPQSGSTLKQKIERWT